MKQVTDYWTGYWERRPHSNLSNFELDRISSAEDPGIELLVSKRLLNFIDPRNGEIVLDAGCGTGTNIVRLSSRVAQIVGMDLSNGMVARAKQRIEAHQITNARAFVGSVTDTGLESEGFDRVLCMSVLQYLDDEACTAALRELIRVAKNGGVLILHVKNLWSLSLGSLALAKRIKSLVTRKVEWVYYRSYRWYERALAGLGARAVHYDSVNILVFDRIPNKWLNKVRTLELQCNGGRLLRRFGADYFIKAKIVKPRGSTLSEKAHGN